jgi:hypothetical protein
MVIVREENELLLNEAAGTAEGWRREKMRKK